MIKKDIVIHINTCIERNIRVIKCDCGGYSEQVKCTKAEIKKQFCGDKKYECCIRAFKCCICKKRILKNLNAPEL